MSSGWLRTAFLLAAGLYVLAGVLAVAFLSIDVPFADAWRHYARLLESPFARGVLAADNGHIEVFANLVRWISLHWLGGSEWMQTLVGLALALATFALLLDIVRRDPQLSPLARAAAGLVLALGVFWLGNARALLHDNDALHVYSTLSCLALAIRLSIANDESPTATRVVAAAVCCAGAAFSFGSGIAAFAAVMALSFVQRAPLRHVAIVAAGAALTLLSYVWIAGGGDAIAWRPLDQLTDFLRVLAAPLMYLVWPVVDPAAASALPHPLDALALPLARWWTQTFGDARASACPFALAGAVFVTVLMAMTWLRRGTMNRSERVGVALAWFGVAAAVLVGVVRVSYFDVHPDQASSPRYLPWSSLAWAGLLLVLVARPRARAFTWGATIGVSVCALAAEAGMAMAMQHQRLDARATAAAAASGAPMPQGVVSENDPKDVAAGAAALRRAGIGMFAPDAGQQTAPEGK
jgi:hypothetical protein